MKIRTNCYFILNFKCKFAEIFVILFFFNNFVCVYFQLQKTLHKYFVQTFCSWIWIGIKKAAGSGSALRKNVGSGSAINECESTAQFSPFLHY